MEDDVRCKLVDREIGEDVLDGIVVFMGLGEVAKEGWQGSGVCDGKGGDMSPKGGEEGFEVTKEFGEFVCCCLEVVRDMGVMCMGVCWRRRAS